jgi:aminoglycoside 3-N-acetyltransferase
VLTLRDFSAGLRRLDIAPSQPVIVHASLSAFGEVHGGVQTLLHALTAAFDTVVMPTFTYKTMITPEVGPPENAITYGSGKDRNRMAEIFSSDMPADSMMGILAEALRNHPDAVRTNHPILSFAGIHAETILALQTTREPLLHIQALIDEEGWVLLMGVDQTVNTSIHFAERLAGRKQFIRWALTTNGVVPCYGFPGCSQGFEQATVHLEENIRTVRLGKAMVRAIPLVHLMYIVCGMLKQDPLALLCNREDCGRCNAVRASVVEHIN